MILHAAIVPPEAALQQLVDAVRGLPPVAAPPPEVRRRLLGRRTPEVAAPAQPVLGQLAISTLRFPVGGFGNVTTSDALAIVDVLETAAREWVPAAVYFAGMAVSDGPGERHLMARLGGDIEGMTSIARAVIRSVEHLGFSVDRRGFRPTVALGPLAAPVQAADVEAALEGFRGDDWMVDHLLVTKQTFAGSDTEEREFRRISVGTPS